MNLDLGFAFFQVLRESQQEKQIDCFNPSQFSLKMDNTSGSVQILLFISLCCRVLKSGLGSNSYMKFRISELYLFLNITTIYFLVFCFFITTPT